MSLYYLCMDRIHTSYLYILIILAVGYHGAGIIAGSHFIYVLRELSFCGLHILGVQLDISSLLHTLVGLRGTSAIHLHRAGQVVAVHLHRSIDESVTSSQQHDDHKDSPRHSKSCERSAKLIPSCRLPYFC